MFPHLPPADPGPAALEALLAAIAKAGEEGSLENERIPAGYTYLGQFVDHDITFDPTSKLQRDNDPQALVNFRTPRFDLDSLYGSGPADQPYLYDWCGPRPGVKLLVGRNPPGCGLAADDLPRNEQGRALIGDARNDENLIVAQLHLLFIRFHNRVADHLCSSRRHARGDELFEETQRIVRWHYGWMVTHDFLERIAGRETARAVLRPGGDGAPPAVDRRFFAWDDGEPIVPVEFSGAAYRFGHSMVRDRYFVSGDPLDRTNDAVRIFPEPGADKPDLGGFRRLPAELEIAWELFFELTQARPNLSMRIDQRLADALFRLPGGGALADLNLQRGRALGLPAGGDVARAMSVPALDERGLRLDAVSDPVAREALMRATPLWYYVVREAAQRAAGMRLGPVGGRIVAEVLVGLLQGDPHSYLSQWPAWRPSLPSVCEGDFTMPDLVRFAEGVDPPAPEDAPELVDRRCEALSVDSG